MKLINTIVKWVFFKRKWTIEMILEEDEWFMKFVFTSLVMFSFSNLKVIQKSLFIIFRAWKNNTKKESLVRKLRGGKEKTNKQRIHFMSWQIAYCVVVTSGCVVCLKTRPIWKWEKRIPQGLATGEKVELTFGLFLGGCDNN